MIAIDSNILIYYLENNPVFFEASKSVLVPALQDGNTVCVSVLLITEILSGSKGEADLGILDHPNFLVSPITSEIARTAGLLRQVHKLSIWDAFHIATAMDSSAKKFITNDKNILKTTIPGIELVPLMSFV